MSGCQHNSIRLNDDTTADTGTVRNAYDCSADTIQSPVKFFLTLTKLGGNLSGGRSRKRCLNRRNRQQKQQKQTKQKKPWIVRNQGSAET
jgi:hypothetical protein